MNDHETTSSGARPRPGGAVVWLAGGAVAAGAGVATAHGLFEVAAAATVPPGIAWIYPLITDGLALVAYAATSRLHGAGARYAWAVVVLAAGLSGIAQATLLAGDPAGPTAAPGGPAVAAPALLRSGVGAWPAIAAAIVAHLLYLLATSRPPAPAVPPAGTGVPGPAPVRAVAVVDRTPSPRPAVTASNPGPARTTPAAEHPSTASTPYARVRAAARPSGGAAPSGRPGAAGDGPRERAERVATGHRARVGGWPTVRQLATTAQVSHGTAQTALCALRAHDDASPITNATTS